MIRSLIAIIAAIFGGLAFAQAVERLALGFGLPQSAALLASWGGASFIAAGAALLLGWRWAPLGWLAAASMFLLSVVSIAEGGASWMIAPGALVVTGLGGWAAVKATGASYAPPFAAKKPKPGLFE
jgi:hypothetical protein